MKYKKVDGMLVVNGKKYHKRFGTRAEVWHETAFETSGGLKKKDLFMNKHGRIVSRTKHTTAKKEKRLLEHGWGFKKGEFGPVKMGPATIKRLRKSHKTRRGGSMSGPALNLSGDYPNAVGMIDSTSKGAVFPTTLGGGVSVPLSGAPYPSTVGNMSDPHGAGMSQQDFLKAPNNTPADLALLKSTGGRRSRKHHRTHSTKRHHRRLF